MSEWKGMILAKCDDFGIMFAPRHLLEENPKYRQIIPYVVFRDGDRYACFQRVKGHEKRLSNKYTIGVGGHIDISDMEFADQTSEESTLQTLIILAAQREIFEETLYEGAYFEDFKQIGTIESSDTPVDCVHYGVVFELELSKGGLSISMNDLKEPEMILIGYKTKEELMEIIEVGDASPDSPQLESWSQIVVKNII
jgi:predicted NUDIX family phosphoesterase